MLGGVLGGVPLFPDIVRKLVGCSERNPLAVATFDVWSDVSECSSGVPSEDVMMDQVSSGAF